MTEREDCGGDCGHCARCRDRERQEERLADERMIDRMIEDAATGEPEEITMTRDTSNDSLNTNTCCEDSELKCCSRCGQSFDSPACGPVHAVISTARRRASRSAAALGEPND